MTGLTVMESSKFHNYAHFREPQKLQNKTLLERANFDRTIDFMDSIDEDIPKGFIKSFTHRNIYIISTYTVKAI